MRTLASSKSAISEGLKSQIFLPPRWRAYARISTATGWRALFDLCACAIAGGNPPDYFLATPLYIHGDIRIENIVFGHGTSYLIDFDLARKQEDSPKGYYSYGIRHRSARPMDKKHDIFSMKKVMAEKFPAVKEQVEHILKTGDLIQWIDQQS